MVVIFIDGFWPFLGGGGYVFLAKKGGPKSGLKKMGLANFFRFFIEICQLFGFGG
jgi:hypothetical protein